MASWTMIQKKRGADPVLHRCKNCWRSWLCRRPEMCVARHEERTFVCSSCPKKMGKDNPEIQEWVEGP